LGPLDIIQMKSSSKGISSSQISDISLLIKITYNSYFNA
jgi:hypothetical protein